LQRVRQSAAYVHRIPPPNVRDDRETPLWCGAGWRTLNLICQFCKSEYFSGKGLTEISDLPDRAIMLMALDKLAAMARM
jgi:hypothetical protein